jgi:hypothetical protein
LNVAQFFVVLFDQGSVEIKDGDVDQSKIKIDVIKEAENDEQLNDVALSHRFYNNGNAVILVLNVVCIQLLMYRLPLEFCRILACSNRCKA